MGKTVVSRRVTNSFLVGLFVIFGTILTAIVIIWLGASQFLRENVPYVTYFDGSVGGLETGSEVKYQGLPIGTVSKISVAPDGRLIEVIMSIHQNMVINDSMRIKPELSGIAGGKYLQIFYPENKEVANSFPALSFKPPYPVIRSAPSGFEELETAAREVMNNLRLLRVGEISSETVNFLRQTTMFMEAATEFLENPKLFTTIDNLEKASISLDGFLAKADSSRIIANLENTTSRLLNTAISLEDFADGLNKQIEGLELPEKTTRAFNNFDSLMSNSRIAVMAITNRTETMLFNFNDLLESIKQTSRQARKSLREISDNPTQVLFSEPPPKEK